MPFTNKTLSVGRTSWKDCPLNFGFPTSSLSFLLMVINDALSVGLLASYMLLITLPGHSGSTETITFMKKGNHATNRLFNY
jgi:hypothetical protein